MERPRAMTLPAGLPVDAARIPRSLKHSDSLGRKAVWLVAESNLLC